MTRPEKVRLGDLLVEQRLISAEQLQQALAAQRGSGRKLGRILTEQGMVTEAGLAEALARQLRIPYVDLKHAELKAELVQRLPETQARRFRAIVLRDLGHALQVGMADPTDLQAFDEVGRALKRDIEPAAVTEGQLLAAIDQFYRRTEQIHGLAKELGAELGDAPVEFGDILGLSAGAEDAPVVKLLQTVFEEAVRTRASDVHVEPQETALRIRFRIDGVLHVQTEADPKIASALVLRLKLMSGLDISEKRLPQDGRFNVRVRAVAVDVRISTMPTQWGESVVLRLLNPATGLLGLDRLGLPEALLVRLREAIHRQSGMVLVTGPTGSGKTTTLYAALAELNSTERKIMTVEDPVEYRLPGICQVQVNDKIELSFERVLRSTLRQDPDVILVGEMRDQTTAEIGLRAAMTGHMVLSTLHTNDALSTPIRLMDMGVPRYMVALSLQLVLAQRLLRQVCESCAQPVDPSPQEQAWLRGLLGESAAAPALCAGTGCVHCNGTGYAGRTGVYELLEMTAPVVAAAHDADPGAFVRAARAQIGTHTLRHEAARLAALGRTTVSEAMKVATHLEAD